MTGANSGLGLQTAIALAAAGAHVTLACRDGKRGETARAKIAHEVPRASTELRPLDLASLASVRAFAKELDREGKPLDLLINNAGVMAAPQRKTEDGFELQLGTNHLGHYALTGLLLERLRAAPAPRVITVSSQGHRYGRIAFDDLQFERRYNAWRAYGQSKLANLLFARELQRRAEAAGLELRSVAVHPGYSNTNLTSSGPQLGSKLRLDAIGMKLTDVLLATSDRFGAEPSLYAATHPDVPGGAFVGPTRLFQSRGPVGLVDSTRAGKDPEVAKRLWEVSGQLTGVRYLDGD